jgi:hypothetical protein
VSCVIELLDRRHGRRLIAFLVHLSFGFQVDGAIFCHVIYIIPMIHAI